MMGSVTGMMGGTTVTTSGLTQTMLDAMDDLWSDSWSTADSGFQSMTGMMSGWIGSAGTTTSGLPAPAQTMIQAMQNVLAATAAGSGGTAVSQIMTTAMQTVLSEVASGTFAAGTLPTMMESTAGHVVSVDTDRSQVTMTPGAAGATVSFGGASMHMAAGVDRVIATDGSIMMGLNDGVAGPVYRLYQAALDRMPDAAGMLGWMGAMQNGLSLNSMAQAFMGSAEYQSHYGQMTDQQFVDQLYQNVLHRAPDAPGEQAWMGGLANGLTRDVVLVGFAQSPENMALTAAHAGPGGYWVY